MRVTSRCGVATGRYRQHGRGGHPLKEVGSPVKAPLDVPYEWNSIPSATARSPRGRSGRYGSRQAARRDLPARSSTTALAVRAHPQS